MLNERDKALLLAELASRSRIRVWEAAKAIGRDGHPKRDADLIAALIRHLRSGNSIVAREAAAHALGSLYNKRAIPALESVLRNADENPNVRGQAAETLARLSANRSVPVLTRCLKDRSKIVRFWCAYALGVAGTLSTRKARVALPQLKKLADTDHRVVRGFWSVADEARWAAANIEGRVSEAEEIEKRLERRFFKNTP